MNDVLNNCKLCPRNCSVNRNRGERGFCAAGSEMTIAKYYLHKWEEPCITGQNGSGTIFFSYCNLKCLFCQNYKISTLNYGIGISIEKFSDICLELQNRGATNINLVTPTHYVPLIIDGIKLAKEKGLIIPIVYNSSGYENVDTIKMLEGIVDIYLPDFKYYSDEYATKYSKCKNYFKYASLAIDEMVRQKGRCIFDKEGNMVSGVLVRHLLLPNMEEDSKKILKYLYEKYNDNIYISIMNQYTPVRKCKYDELNSKVEEDIYNDIIDYAWDIGIRNAFIQEDGAQSESFIPNFNVESLTE
ncbi:MAG: radical SAM protein [Bacilli bacterium]|nr:radical SAM protein [Bacilli bacterium]